VKFAPNESGEDRSLPEKGPPKFPLGLAIALATRRSRASRHNIICEICRENTCSQTTVGI